MKHIRCPETGDPAELLDGSICTVETSDDTSYIFADNTWQLTLVLPDEQKLNDRVVKWDQDRWQEQD